MQVFDGALPAEAGATAEEKAQVIAAARADPATTAEIRSLCSDLAVLGRSELKQLLKWRLVLRKPIDKARKEAEKEERETLDRERAAAAAASGEGEGEDAEEVALLREMAAIQERMEMRSKREKKKAREEKKKAKIRNAQAKQSEREDVDMELFDLKRISRKDDVERLGRAGVPEEWSSEEEEREGMEEWREEDSDDDDRDSEEEDQLR